MKKLMTLALFASLSMAASGCIPVPEDKSPDDDRETECFAGCEEPDPDPDTEPDPETAPVIKGTFISGHLGSYWDCPGEGYSESGADSAESGGAFAGDAAPCAEGEECTYAPLNCEDGQLTIRLTNSGKVAALGLQVTKIELFNADGESKAVLPLIAVEEVGTPDTFEGELDASSDIDLRVLFQGPVHAYQLLAPEDDGSGDRAATPEGRIELTIEAENHEDIVIEAEGLYDLPPIAT